MWEEFWDTLKDPSISAWAKIVLMGLIAVFLMLWRTVWRWNVECREDRTKLRGHLDESRGQITALAVDVAKARKDAEHAKTMAMVPCELVECPKRKGIDE